MAVHQLAVRVYKMNLHMHQGDVDSIANWTMPKPADADDTWFVVPPRPSIFNHPSFLDHDVYPEHEADLTGYWAEDRILGGVVAFDRRGEATSSTPPNIYLLPCRRRVTNRLCQLRDDQQGVLESFLLGETAAAPPDPCPLPILPDYQNRVRVNVHEAIMHHKVYRDNWEHRPWSIDEVRFFDHRPKPELDYPEVRELLDIVNSAPLSAERVELPHLGDHSIFPSMSWFASSEKGTDSADNLPGKSEDGEPRTRGDHSDAGEHEKASVHGPGSRKSRSPERGNPPNSESSAAEPATAAKHGVEEASSRSESGEGRGGKSRRLG